jgi:hypothetical protein
VTCGLTQSTCKARDRTQFTKEANLADRNSEAIDWHIAMCRCEGEGERQVECRLVQFNPTDKVGVDITVTELYAGATYEHGGKECEACRIEPSTGASRCTECGASNERLHLNEHRAAPLE